MRRPPRGRAKLGRAFMALRSMPPVPPMPWPIRRRWTRCSKASASEATRIVMDELLQDFLTEAGELLADVDVKLVELEKRPADSTLLNDVFRGFHTIKGGAGFVNLPMLVDLCHRTENVFDLLRK